MANPTRSVNVFKVNTNDRLKNFTRLIYLRCLLRWSSSWIWSFNCSCFDIQLWVIDRRRISCFTYHWDWNSLDIQMSVGLIITLEYKIEEMFKEKIILTRKTGSNFKAPWQLTYRQPAQNGVLADQLCWAIYCIHLSIMPMKIAITIT